MRATPATDDDHVPGPPVASRSFFIANPNRVVADGASTATVTLTASDAWGNNIDGGLVTL